MINGGPHWYDERTPLFLDLEFDGHPRDPTTARIVRAVASYKGVYSTFTGDPVALQRLASFVASECDLDGPGFLVAHNAKAELGWLKYLGLELRRLVVYDTMLGEWVLRAGLPAQHGALSLDGMATRRSAGVKDEWITMLFGSFKASDLPEEPLKDHCLLDVALTESSYYKQKQELKAKELLPIQYCRSMLTPVLAEIELNGLQLDALAVESEYAKSIKRREELAQKLYTLTGGINLASNKQLGDYLFTSLGFSSKTQTAKGAPSVSLDVIRALVPKSEEQRAFLEMYLEYNDLDSAITKYLELFHTICEENSGLLFGIFNQGTTGTHRLSSSGVPFKGENEKKARSAQLQNLPRDFKKLFVPRSNDYLICEVDGAQLEFRIAAALAQDPVALREIGDMVDVHAITAETLTKAGEPTTRQAAKASTFAPLFGGNGKTKAQKAYAKFFKAKYKAIAKMQESWVADVLTSRDKTLRTPYGLTYNFPECRTQPDGYVSGTTNIYNFAIQGLSTAEIIPLCLALLWHNCPKGVRIVNTIHDSIVAEVHKDYVEEWKQLCIEVMCVTVRRYLKQLYGYTLNVSLGVGVKVGERWGSGEEVTYQTNNDGSCVYEIVKVDGKKQKVPYSSGGK